MSVGPLVRPSVSLSVFKYLGDRSLVFSETLVVNKVKKVTRPDFRKDLRGLVVKNCDFRAFSPKLIIKNF